MKLELEWLHRADVAKVLQAIHAAGGEARFVGGCVRDAILGRPLGDFDLATNLPPEQVMAAATQAGLKVVPTGLKHGTVTVIAEHKPFEVTTLRRDVATNGRHAEVEYTDSWQEDAARRDFTMNALFCDAQGNVTDYFSGLADLEAGRVRFVGNAGTRIEEDVLRILRFFRFHAHYGHGAMDEAALAACRSRVALLPGLSAERVRTELLKLLLAADPVPTWQVMLEIGALAALNLPLTNISALHALVTHEAALQQPTALRRLFVLCEGDIATVARALRLSNAETLRLKAMAQSLEKMDIFQLAYWHGVEAVTDQLFIRCEAEASVVSALASWQRPQFPLNGSHLRELGVENGPEMGRILHIMERWWVAQDFAPDLRACLAQATAEISKPAT